MSAVFKTDPEVGFSPQVITGNNFAVIPFGGSMGDNDLALGSSQQISPLKNFLKESVKITNFLKVKFKDKLPQKDSSQLVKKDWDSLLKQIESTKQDEVIVTMGMTKLTDVAKYIEKNLDPEILAKKQIIFTASHDLFYQNPSDAGFQLGFACGSRFGDQKGVSVSINAGLYKPDEIDIFPNREISYHDQARELTEATISDTVLFALGGTIEDIELDVLRKMERGFCKEYILNFIGPRKSPNFHTIRSIDSREMIDQDVAQLKANIIASPNKNILFTVGSFKAVEVVEKLAEDEEFIQHLKDNGKKVVSVSAMKLPSKNNSDAPFSLGFVFGAVEHLEPGIYNSVHGIIAEPGAIVKNEAKERFEAVES